VFGGLDLLERIKRGLVAAVRAEGKTNIAQLVGRKTDEWAAGRVALRETL
jgi:dihydroorotate dehydrogenase